MKDQYFGDEGDFAKYGLLRALAAEGLSLCVAWMKTEDSGTFGGDIGYLEKPDDWRDFDPKLFDLLKDKVGAKDRKVAHLETSGLLPKDTEYCGQPFSGLNRDRHFQFVAKAAAGKDLLFLDPDIGIGTPKARSDTDEHILTSDLKALSCPTQSLIIFEHYDRYLRKLDRCDYANDKAQQLFHCVPAKAVYSVRGKRAALLVAVMDPQETQIVETLKKFQDRWASKVQICKYTLQ